MWYAPEKYDIKVEDLNAEFKKLKGGLEDKEAKVTLDQFLRVT